MAVKLQRAGGVLYFAEQGELLDIVPNGVFQFGFNPMIGGYLYPVSDKLQVPEKLYAIEDSFIKHIQKTWADMTDRNTIGVMLYGMQGSGKSVTAKVLANSIEQPVILVASDYGEAFGSFLQHITQPITILIDEYEKIFRAKDHTLLTVMDGMGSNSRRLWILTANDLKINEKMLERPGRLRYIKEFSGLPFEVLRDLVNDLLRDKRFAEDVLKYLTVIPKCSIDVARAVIEETNIHNMSPTGYSHILNVGVGVVRMDLVPKAPVANDGDILVPVDSNGDPDYAAVSGS